MALAREWTGARERASSLAQAVPVSGETSRFRLGEMIGRSAAMERMFLQMRYLAGHLKLVLIEGEAGTGKTLAAQTLHRLSTHREASCVTVAADLFLQGLASGETLAHARGGTLYLKGLEAASADAQSRLFQLVDWQQRSQALGRILPAPRWLGLDSAISAPRALILGSRRPLRSLVQLGRFRNDLLLEISGAHLVLPPLRDRREDLPLLAAFFLKRGAARYAQDARVLSPEALEQLRGHRWPGNLRELETYLIEGKCFGEPEGRLVRDFAGTGLRPAVPWSEESSGGPQVRPELASEGGSAAAAGHAAAGHVAAGHVAAGHTAAGHVAAGYSVHRGHGAHVPGHPDRDRETSGSDPNLDRVILRHVQQVLTEARGNKLRAARLLGISRSTLYRILERKSGPGLSDGDECACAQAPM